MDAIQERHRPTMVLETERLIVRELSRGDAAFRLERMTAPDWLASSEIASSGRSRRRRATSSGACSRASFTNDPDKGERA